MTITRVLIADIVDQSADQPADFAAVTTAASTCRSEVRSACGWDARITTGEERDPGTMIDCAQFDSMDEAKRWTVAATLYWQAHAPDGWWVTGGITARADS